MTQITKKPLTIAVLALAGGAMLVGTMAAEARGRDQGMRPTFEQIDANGDGQVTLAEIQAMGAARFASADANGDGELSRDEIINAGNERAAKRADRMLERLDADGNGSLSQAELEAGRSERGGNRAERMFERADANGDGVITAEEFAELKNRGPKGSRGSE